MDIRPPKASTALSTRRQPDAVIDETAPADSPTHPAKAVPKAAAVVPKRRRWYRRIGWWWLAIILALVALAGGIAWYVMASARPVARAVSSGPPPVAKPTTVPDPLTGLPVSSSQAAQPIMAVMIENLDPDARPQSGLGQAGVVYEALSEGGITRFMALFQEPLPPTIGPVRSLRPYFLDWALEYGIPVVHAGGSIPALQQVISTGAQDINALGYDGSYFYRTHDRVAPHNFYTNAQLLSKLDAALGFAKPPTFTPLARKADQPATGVAPHPTISIQFSYSDYNVMYRYDAASNSYARFMAGVPHIDRNTGKQIMVKNVVVEYVPTSYSTQANGKPETDLALIGSGKALVFTDGNVTQATWSKSAAAAQTQLTDASGQPVKLNAGNTWYSVVPTTNSVTY